MYGRCSNCVKNLSCFKPSGMRFGFCETDFEPKEKPQIKQLGLKGMQWSQLSSSEWEAKGKDSMFRIKRFKGQFWSRYDSEIYEPFNLPPKSKLSEAKEMCENNEYWEAV